MKLTVNRYNIKGYSIYAVTFYIISIYTQIHILIFYTVIKINKLNIGNNYYYIVIIYVLFYNIKINIILL